MMLGNWRKCIQVVGICYFVSQNCINGGMQKTIQPAELVASPSLGQLRTLFDFLVSAQELQAFKN